MSRAKKILIQFAMEAEASPLVSALGFGGFEEWIGPHLPGKAVRGSLDGREIMILHTGKDARFGVDNVGPHPAAVTAYAAIVMNEPDVVISAGTAGGFNRHGAEIGDVYISTGALRFHDRRIPIDGFREYGIGAYPCWDASSIAAELGLKMGIVSSGASLDATAEDLKQLEVGQAVVKDMEAAAMGWVAWQCRKPMVAVKAITDLVEAPASTAEQFAQNFDAAVTNLATMLNKLVRRI